MKKVKIILFLLILLFLSCRDNNNIKNNICNGDFKYWVLLQDEYKDVNCDPDYPDIIFFYFDKNGKYYLAHRYNINSKFVVDDYQHSDMIVPNDWELINDSTIKINYWKYRIDKISKDIMMLSDTENKRYRLLITAPDELIPEEYRKILGTVSD